MRYFIELAYKGTNYHGWQIQPDAKSVQETLNKALSILLKSEIDILGAGRTDAGVHAKQMFAHFDVDIDFDKEKLKERNIHISSMGHGKLRIVTHLDYREVMHSYVLETFERIVVK